MPRTDNDSWDLATSVGATATLVAAGRARASIAEHPVIEDRFAQPLVQAVGVDFFTRWGAGELDAADVDIPDHPWGMQPMTDLMAVRTRFIDQFVADAAAAGVRQLVILASGLDARGYRLSWPSDMTVFEIDQPQVIDFKTATLTALGAEPTVDLRTVPVDLRDDWPAALRQASFDTGRPAAWIAEGLLAFLPPVQIMNTAAQKWYQLGLNAHIDDLWYTGERHDIATYLAERGWQTTRSLAGQLLTEAGLPVPVRNDGEAENYYCTAILDAH